VKLRTLILLFLANGFVSFYFWSEYQRGMPAKRALPELLLSLIFVNVALALGKKLGERRTRPK